MTVFYEKTNKTDDHHASPSSFADFFGKNKYNGKNPQNMGDGRSERNQTPLLIAGLQFLCTIFFWS